MELIESFIDSVMTIEGWAKKHLNQSLKLTASYEGIKAVGNWGQSAMALP